MITVFTPTYNRAYTLPALYESLTRQTDGRFEWIVVDDGSEDNTENLVHSFIQEGLIQIVLLTQSHGGKHRAINRALKIARGDLFFIVDSDDALPPNAIAVCHEQYEGIRGDDSFSGICGRKAYFDGNLVGGGKDAFEVLDTPSLAFRYKYGMKGDMAEVTRTDVLKQYPFPEFDGERFCPEAIVWNRLSLRYKFRYFNKPVYLCNYLPDGLTAHITEIRRKSPQASMTCYSELKNAPVPVLIKLKAAINFWRFSFPAQISFSKKVKMIGFFSLWAFPFGAVLYIIDFFRTA